MFLSLLCLLRICANVVVKLDDLVMTFVVLNSE